MCESAVLRGTADSQSKLSAWEVDAKPFRAATYHKCMTIITKRNKDPAGLNEENKLSAVVDFPISAFW